VSRDWAKTKDDAFENFAIEIAEQDGALALRMGPRKASFPLKHFDRDVFCYQPTGEMASGLSGVMFAIGPDQTAATVVIENLNVDGQGTFIRSGKK